MEMHCCEPRPGETAADDPSVTSVKGCDDDNHIYIFPSLALDTHDQG